MKVLCPQCRHEVPAQQINVANDFGLCPKCGQGFKPSATVSIPENFNKTMQSPPKGCWYHSEAGKHIIGASTRSPLAFFLVPFMLVWSGGSLGGIYGSQLAKGEFDLFQSLFGIPFILGGGLFWCLALMAIMGKNVVTIEGDSLSVFIGIGNIGWTRRMSWKSIQTITESQTSGRSTQTVISLNGTDRMVFGWGLNESRRFFLLNALNYIKAQTH